MSERRQVLESLLEHPGWALFAEHVKSEWAPGACWRRVTVDGQAQDLVRNTNVEIGRIMEWPKDEIQRLLQTEQSREPVLSRGGYQR